jgi:4a-hydroxytetrahydrobiopterin dehydratase
MVEVKDIHPSSGDDATTLATEATRLIDHGRWRLCNDGKGVEREFRFKTFKATWVPYPSQAIF